MEPFRANLLTAAVSFFVGVLLAVVLMLLGSLWLPIGHVEGRSAARMEPVDVIMALLPNAKRELVKEQLLAGKTPNQIAVDLLKKDPAYTLNIQAIREMQMPRESTAGLVLLENWDRPILENLSDVPFDQPANRLKLIDKLEVPAQVGDSYGTRVRGHLHPPASGWYQFWVASDNASEFWFSKSEDPQKAERVASVTVEDQWTNPHEWEKYAEQQSKRVWLTAGKKYFFELKHYENDQGDHAAVAWRGPNLPRQVIVGRHLSSFPLPERLREAYAVKLKPQAKSTTPR